MPPLLLACLTCLSVALPGSTLGLLWPSVHSSFHEPVGALGVVLVVSTLASVIASAATGRVLARLLAGPVLAAGALLVTAALVAEVLAPSFSVFIGGSAIFGTGGAPKPRARALAGAVVFTAVETGIESSAGIWGYIFLTAGRGLPRAAAGAVVSAYWAMMVLGRMVLGPVAERVGARAVLGGAVVGVAVGAALMSVPGSAALAVAGMIVFGLAAAPVFPLVTLTTKERTVGTGTLVTARAVGFQVAASAIRSAALPAGIGVAIGVLKAGAVGPLLLVLAVAMGGLYLGAMRQR